LLGFNNLVQPFNNLSQFLWRRPTHHLSYAFDRERVRRRRVLPEQLRQGETQADQDERLSFLRSFTLSGLMPHSPGPDHSSRPRLSGGNTTVDSCLVRSRLKRDGNSNAPVSPVTARTPNFRLETNRQPARLRSQASSARPLAFGTRYRGTLIERSLTFAPTGALHAQAIKPRRIILQNIFHRRIA
jgi:hypothetical protein